TGRNDNADLLGLQDAVILSCRNEQVVVRLAVLATEHAARAVARAVACRVGFCGLADLDFQIEVDAEAAAIAPLAAGVGTEFVPAEMQRKAHLCDLDAAEFDATDGVPLADRRPAVAAGRRAAARPRMKHVPDETAAGARIFALDGDAESSSPAAHRPF